MLFLYFIQVTCNRCDRFVVFFLVSGLRMRIRRLSALFWATCLVTFILILYVVTDLSFKLPSIKPAIEDVDNVSNLFLKQ